MPPKSTLRKYRERVSHSKCRKLPTKKCNRDRRCTMAKGKKRKFCRKAHNRPIHAMTLRRHNKSKRRHSSHRSCKSR